MKLDVLHFTLETHVREVSVEICNNTLRVENQKVFMHDRVSNLMRLAQWLSFRTEDSLLLPSLDVYVDPVRLKEVLLVRIGGLGLLGKSNQIAVPVVHAYDLAWALDS